MMFVIVQRFILLILIISPTCFQITSSFIIPPRPTSRNRHIKFRGGAMGVNIPKKINEVIIDSHNSQETYGSISTISPIAITSEKSNSQNISQDRSSRQLVSKSTKRWLKYGSLFFLVLENSALTCTMRWSRARSAGPLYYTSTAVVVSECMKMLVSSFFLLKDCGSLETFRATINRDIFLKPDESLKLLIPGLLYTLQNNLQYIAASNLEPAVFQVTYQIKMLTTAILSVTMLNKKLKPRQWGGVSLLMIGLVMVQLSQSNNIKDVVNNDKLIGFSAVLSACTLAGFAGCYLERILKGCSTSLWIRNIQLSFWGITLGTLSMLIKDGRKVKNNGFFYGYNKIVFSVITIQAVGGLLISLVVRYGDALLKGFATGLAIILTTIISVLFFDFKITPQYLFGAGLTLIAVLMYSGILTKLFSLFMPNIIFPSSPSNISTTPSDYPWSLVAGGATLRSGLERKIHSKWI